MSKTIDETKQVQTDIVEGMIERPEKIDDAIEQLRERLGLLRALRKVSVRLYGEPDLRAGGVSDEEADDE